MDEEFNQLANREKMFDTSDQSEKITHGDVETVHHEHV
jgi:hypothetical protein